MVQGRCRNARIIRLMGAPLFRSPGDPRDPQALIEDYWGPIRKLLGPSGVFGVGGVSFKGGSYHPYLAAQCTYCLLSKCISQPAINTTLLKEPISGS